MDFRGDVQGSAVAQGEFPFQVFDRASHRFHQHQQMVGQIGSFIDEPAPVAVDGFKDGFCGFLSHLFCDGLGRLDEQSGRIGSFRQLSMAVLDYL